MMPVDHDHSEGREAREDGHRKHRRPKCLTHLIGVEFLILDALLAVGAVVATDLDGKVKPSPSGNKTFVGTAFANLKRAGMIAPIREPFQAYAGGRHGPFIYQWRLAQGVDREAVEQYKASRSRLIGPDDQARN